MFSFYASLKKILFSQAFNAIVAKKRNKKAEKQKN